MDHDGLVERWPLPLARTRSLALGVLSRYAEATRHYHDLRHLREVLDAVELLLDDEGESDAGGPAPDDLALRLAAWFHDAIYDSRRADNEAASADLARRQLTAAGLDQPCVEEVVRLVVVTADHVVRPGDRAAAVLCDADLAILGGTPQRYAEYAAAVRREYAHVDPHDFRRGRTAVLERLLRLDPLFRTATGRARWEAAARHNLSVELAALRAG